MADILRDILLNSPTSSCHKTDLRIGSVGLEFLSALASQSPSAIESTEPKRLALQAHTLFISIQELSKRSHGAIVTSAIGHAALGRSLPLMGSRAADLQNTVLRLEQEAASFPASFDRSRLVEENSRLESRKRALLLLRNVERSVDMMELPVLLSSALSAIPPNFSSALDIYSHTRRLQSMYPMSPLVTGIAQQADQTARHMAAELLLALQVPSLKLAASIRLVGWLRRILPDIGQAFATREPPLEAILAATFLSSRLQTFIKTLGALEPLHLLAVHERQSLLGDGGEDSGYDVSAIVAHSTPFSRTWSSGQHTERYLKRYIEIFREQTFGMLSMYRGIFPETPSDHSSVPPPTITASTGNVNTCATPLSFDALSPPPVALSSFSLPLTEMILETLQRYLPVISDQASRESIITQALYCAGSLGRLGCDFGMLLTDIEMSNHSTPRRSEWSEVARRHRLLTGRLESVISVK